MRRTVPALLALGLLAALVLSVPPTKAPPAHATPVTGESYRTDDWMETNNVVSGFDSAQGYLRMGGAYFNNGNEPSCVVVTGRSPTGSGASQLPGGVAVNEDSVTHRMPSQYRIWATRGVSTAQIAANYTYWVHAQSDYTGDTNSICRHATVTTDANGYFDVTFPRTLADDAAWAVWSPSEWSGGGDFATGNYVVNGTLTADGFQGRAQWGSTWLNQKTFEIDYLADTRTSVQGGEDVGGGPLDMRAGTVEVTTDSGGDATIDYSDFTAPSAPTGAQAVGALDSGDNSDNPAGLIVSSASASAMNIHARDETGAVMANDTFDVSYAAIGGFGGTTMGWGSYGYRMLGPDSGGNPGDSEYCQTDISVACQKLPDEELGNDTGGYQNREVEYESSFTSGANIEGSTRLSLMTSALVDWNGQDLDTPVWFYDSTPEHNEPVVIQGATLGEGVCGVAWNYYDAADNDGVNGIVNTDIVLSTDSENSWGKVGGSGEDCPVEHVYRHEAGHAMGFGHADSSSSLMYFFAGPGYGTAYASINTTDRDNARAVYGYSGSLLGRNWKLSHLADPGEALSSGEAVVTAVGKTQADTDGHPITPIRVAGSAWKGNLPSTLWLVAGEANGMTAGPVGLQVGQRYLVNVRDSDGRILRALPVQGGRVHLDKDLAAAPNDVQGGHASTVALEALRAKA